jgi:hypothetical protein
VTEEAEVRRQLLSNFYQLRHNAGGWVPTSEMNLAGLESIDRNVVGTVCRHLADAGLIEWKPLLGADEGVIVGMARITGTGVDVVEGRKIPSIAITQPNTEASKGGIAPTAVAQELVQPLSGFAFVGASAKGLASTFAPESPKSFQNADQLTSLNQRVSLEMSVDRATIPIVPTLYPVEPANGVVVVQNFITINTNSVEFREFTERIGELIAKIQQSNEISGEVRDKLISEMVAGISILKSPKPDPKLIDLLLRRPLIYIADKATGAAIGALATAAVLALAKLTGLF